MGFSKLIDKVTQAEQALEAREHSVSAHWGQLKGAWREVWTPARIVVAGLLSGFAVGRVRPLAGTAGGGFLHLMTALSGLVPGGSSTQEAADQAEATAEATDAAVVQPTPTASTAPPDPATDPLRDHEALRRQGLL